MGLKINATKRVSVPMQCGWCEQIRVGMTWVPDRRTVYGGRYSRAVCPACRTDFFLDSLSEINIKRR